MSWCDIISELSIDHSWDLWLPSVWGGSFWTASLQYRALRTGARLGRNIGRDDSAFEYEGRASMLLDYLQVSDHKGRSPFHIYTD
jgi:hypothetical protein